MKKIKLSILVVFFVGLSNADAQNTNFGTSSGTLGTSNSFFGYFAGNAAQASSGDNSFFGKETGKSLTTGIRNTAIGSEALLLTTTGNSNTALGYRSLYTNSSGFYNTAVGPYSLYLNTTGSENNASGYLSLYNNTTGTNNTAYGRGSLYANSNGSYNTATGAGSLQNNTASYNTANGYQALYSNVSGISLTAIGFQALSNNTANDNTATGYKTLYANSTGYSNTGDGAQSLLSNTTGFANTAIGGSALRANTTADSNTSIGVSALYSNTTGSGNSAIGKDALLNNVCGAYNTAAGLQAGPTASNLSNTTAVGLSAIPTASNQVRIGNSSVTSIGGYANWSNISDGRFKKEVKEDVLGLEFINQLRPVSYLLDRDRIDAFLGVSDVVKEQLQLLRSKPAREIGFIAQDVESAVISSKATFQGVEKPQSEKDAYAISYATFVVPLVKAVQELSARVEDQQKMMEQQKLRIDSLSSLLGNEGLNRTGKTSVGKAILFQNNPNPFTIGTEIKMELPETIKQAEIVIYNMDGTQLKSIRVNDRGATEAKILAGELRPGLYIYSLIADGEVIDIKRMVLRD